MFQLRNDVISIISVLTFLALCPGELFAREAPSSIQRAVPCAVIEDLGGHVQILDASRTHLSEVSRNTGIDCGSWITTGILTITSKGNKPTDAKNTNGSSADSESGFILGLPGSGWVKLKLRDGYGLRIGSGSFVGLLESNTDGKDKGDHIVLYRGLIYGEARNGAKELRVITANARARFNRSSGVLLFNRREEESQLLGFEGLSTIENRFEGSRNIAVKAGEASTLNFKLLRVVPESPRAMSLTALKVIMTDLHMQGKNRDKVAKVTRKRQDRKFASVFSDTVEQNESIEEVTDDGPATDKRLKREQRAKKAKNAKQESFYGRHEASPVDAKLKEYWINKMAAGENVGEKILYPDKYYGHQQKVSLDVDVNKNKPGKGKKPQDEEEKEKLIEELERIKVE